MINLHGLKVAAGVVGSTIALLAIVLGGTFAIGLWMIPVVMAGTFLIIALVESRR